MSVNVRFDSLYQFADPLYDERQGQYVWGISDPPDPVERDDDQFYEIREEDRFDLIAHRMLGNARYFWIILHYNDIPNALDIANYTGKTIRMPSRTVFERVFLNAAKRSDSSENNG
jgi:hypothetical protein